MWEKVRDLMDRKQGTEDIRWRARLTTEDTTERVRSLVAAKPDQRGQTCLPGRLPAGLPGW